MGPGNDGPEPSAVVLQAILHGVAAGACRAAAREDRSRAAQWLGLANEQRAKAQTHAAIFARACAVASTSSVTPAPTASE